MSSGAHTLRERGGSLYRGGTAVVSSCESSFTSLTYKRKSHLLFQAFLCECARPADVIILHGAREQKMRRKEDIKWKTWYRTGQVNVLLHNDLLLLYIHALSCWSGAADWGSAREPYIQLRLSI